MQGKKMIIEIDVETGNTVVKTDKGDEVSVVEDIGEALTGGKISDAQTFTIMGVHKSPGCRYVYIGGRWYRVCS